MARQPATVTPRRGAPSLYTEEVGRTICERIARGELISRVCDEPEMPPLGTVLGWIGRYTDFSAAYARAREARAELLAEQIQTIADDDSIPPESRRIRVDARKWLASKLFPKVYGDKLQVDQTVTVQTLTDEQLRERAADLERRLAAIGGDQGGAASQGEAGRTLTVSPVQ